MHDILKHYHCLQEKTIDQQNHKSKKRDSINEKSKIRYVEQYLIEIENGIHINVKNNLIASTAMNTYTLVGDVLATSIRYNTTNKANNIIGDTGWSTCNISCSSPDTVCSTCRNSFDILHVPYCHLSKYILSQATVFSNQYDDYTNQGRDSNDSNNYNSNDDNNKENKNNNSTNYNDNKDNNKYNNDDNNNKENNNNFYNLYYYLDT